VILILLLAGAQGFNSLNVVQATQAVPLIFNVLIPSSPGKITCKCFQQGNQAALTLSLISDHTHS